MAPRVAHLPLLFALTAGACSADTFYEQLAPRPQCRANGPHRKYVVSEFILPSLGDGIEEDFDGDGKPDNAIGGLLADSRSRFLDDDLFPRSIIDLVNMQLAAGRGALLLDVNASEELPGCAEIAVHHAAPDRDGQGSYRIALGSKSAVLRGQGTQQGARSIPYSQLAAEDARILDLYLPLATTTHHLRLYGARVTFNRSADGWLEGTLHGVVRQRDLDQTLWPTWAREQTASIHKLAAHFGNQLPDAVKREIGYREDTDASRVKCLEKQDCCTQSPSTCVILPEEVRQYYAKVPLPDLRMFDAEGSWQPVPGAPPEQKDSYSFGMRFRAQPANFEFACPPGTFCNQPVPTQERLIAGWANRSSDLWVLTDGCHALHHDGLAWAEYFLGDCNCSLQHRLTGAIWGARSDEVWAAITPGTGWRRWDGGRWRNLTRPECSSTVVYSIQGTAADDIWAVAATDKAIEAEGLILRHDQQQPEQGWAEQWRIPGNLMTLLSLSKEVAFAAGYVGNLFALSHAGWQRVRAPAALSANLLALAGNSPQNVWAFTGGSQVAAGTCIHYDGRSWARLDEGFCDAPQAGYLSAWMDQKGVLWSGGEHGMLRVYDPARDARFREVFHDGGRDVSIEKLFGVSEEAAAWALTSAGKLLRYQP